MKRIIFASVLAMLGGAAQAADAVVAQEPAPVADLAPAFTWTGGYVGLQGGYGWGDVDVELTDILFPPSAIPSNQAADSSVRMPATTTRSAALSAASRRTSTRHRSTEP